MEYTYTLTENCKILIPFNIPLSDVEKEVVEQTAEKIVYKSTYPNGFVIETVQTKDKIIVKTNKPLIDNGDKTFSISE